MNKRNDFYVYVLIDKDFNIRYVGEGTGGRVNKCSGRSKEYKSLVLNGAETLILYDSLTKEKARALEQSLIDRFWKTGLLLNKRKDNKNIVNDLPYKVAKDLFEISEDSPSGLIWKKKISRQVVVGTTAGSTDCTMYWRVQYKGCRYRVHRIIWVLLKKRKIKEGFVINHIDSNPSNNRLDNLEEVSHSENSLKRLKLPRKNTREVLKIKNKITSSVYKCKNTNRWIGYVRNIGKQYSRSFSILRRGEAEALCLAKEWVEIKILELKASMEASPCIV